MEEIPLGDKGKVEKMCDVDGKIKQKDCWKNQTMD